MSARDNPLFMLCLGANVEFELERCTPDPLESTTAVNAESNPPANQDVAAPGTADDGAGEKKTKGGKPRKSKKNPGPEPGPETNTDPKGKRKGKGKEKAVVPQPPKEKPKPKPKPTAPHERLKISMVHGDVLILSGGDYIVRHPSRPPRLSFHADLFDSAVHTNANRDVYL